MIKQHEHDRSNKISKTRNRGRGGKKKKLLSTIETFSISAVHIFQNVFKGFSPACFHRGGNSSRPWRKRGNGAERPTEPIIPRYDFRGLARLTVTRGSPWQSTSTPQSIKQLTSSRRAENNVPRLETTRHGPTSALGIFWRATLNLSLPPPLLPPR